MRRARSLRLGHTILAGALLGIMLLLSACGGDPHLQQQANAAHSQLDQQLQHARSIGVPASFLQPITQQEQKLTSSSTPFSLFDDTPANNYYKNQNASYQQLLSKLSQVIAIVTGQAQGQAQQDLQSFNQALTNQKSKKVGNIQAFTLRYNADQQHLTTAQYPDDYAAVSKDATDATTLLNYMGTTYDQLLTFKTAVSQMQQAHLDVTAMQQQYTNDLTTYNAGTTMDNFQQLNTTINAQYQLAVVSSIQSLPYVGAAKLSTFEQDLTLLKTYGIDNSPYQKLYNADEVSMSRATTIPQYLKVSKKIDSDMASMHDDLVMGASNYLITQLNKEATTWGNAHLFHDKYDGHSYIPDSGYTMDGIGYWLQQENSWSVTTADYQSVVDDDMNEEFNFGLYQQNYSDPTPYNKVHQTDLEMMQHYPSLKTGTVIMVSMSEEALRFYDNGKLVTSFLITAGRTERPTLPGVWGTQLRESPTEFKSSDPPSSPFYYPPTPIHYAIEYHYDGFFVHDSWWRNEYGPGTQFPHADSSGNISAYDGSHGCVNVQEDQAAWLYSHTDWSTQVVIY